MRGFEIAKGFEDRDINLPKRSTSKSACYDIELVEDMIIGPKQVVRGITGLKAYMNDDEVLMLFARSSLPSRHNLILPNGVGIIDADYYGNPDNDGAIMVQLYNFGDKEVILRKGERVAQAMFRKYLVSENEDEPTKKRVGGFGSTG